MEKLAAVVGAVLAAIIVGGPMALGVIAGAILVPTNAIQTTINCAGSLPATGQWRVPFVDTTYTVTSGFGPRVDPITGATSALHNGVDLATTQSPIVAAASGIVMYAGDNGNGFGNHVMLDHGDGITTRYGHLSRIKVKTGDRIERGAVIGLAGSTGRSTGPHVHYEVRRKGNAVNPARYLKAGLELAGLL